ncbi:MAG: hypothetical protein L0Z62_04495 [Gemmataceae bacterium]|nr:hypothetical protein [Gemmataceae bacterium]
MRFLGQALGGAALLALALLLPVSGCSKKDADQPKDDQAKGKGTEDEGKRKKHKHEHAEEGPNGGALAEWGDEKYHAEFLPDHKQQQATVWILDGHAKKYVPIEAKTIQLTLTNVTPPVDVTLKADPQKTDPEGKSSRYVGTHQILAKEMEFKGTISGKVGDTPYSGKFEEKEHPHEKDKKQ